MPVDPSLATALISAAVGGLIIRKWVKVRKVLSKEFSLKLEKSQDNLYFTLAWQSPRQRSLSGKKQ